MQGVKNGLKAVVGVAGAVASFAVVIVTRGKVDSKNESASEEERKDAIEEMK